MTITNTDILANSPISFPGLFGDWEFTADSVALHIGHGIYWYGIILGLGVFFGMLLCLKQAGHYGIREDNLLDLVLMGVPIGILGARTAASSPSGTGGLPSTAPSSRSFSWRSSTAKGSTSGWGP